MWTRPLARLLTIALLPAIALGVAPSNARAATGGGFVAVTPARILDTRTTSRLIAARPLRLALTVPAGAIGVSVNLTITQPSAAGWAAIHPCDQTPGATSTLNFVTGLTVANASPYTSTASGVCVTAAVATHAIVDVSGWWSTTNGSALSALNPRRLFDTRLGGQSPTRRQSVRLPVDRADAAGLTLVVSEASAPGWAAVHPCNQPPGTTSTLNFETATTVANLALVAATNGVCVTTSVAAHVIVDQVAATTPDGPAMIGRTPRRIVDSRDQLAWIGDTGVVRLAAGPARSVLLNVTAVTPLGGGFVTVWPCDDAPPGVSQLSWSEPRNVATAVLARTNASGDVCLRPSIGTHLIVDVLATDADDAPVVVSISGRTTEWVFGRSVEGRPLVARAFGPLGALPVLGVGIIHGNEQSGLPIAQRLTTQTVPPGVVMWIIDSINPDGQARPIRQNANGVDLNRNFPVGWRAGSPGSNYPGRTAASEPETLAMIRFLAVVQPRLGVWWHTVGNYADDSRSSMAQPELLERYVARAAVGIDDAPCSGFCGGTASQYANASLENGSHFVVELPEPITASQVAAHAAAFLVAASITR